MVAKFGILGGVVGIAIFLYNYYTLQNITIFKMNIYQQIGIILVMCIGLWFIVKNESIDIEFFRKRFSDSWNIFLYGWLISQIFLYIFGNYIADINRFAEDSLGSDSTSITGNSIFMSTLVGLIFPGAISALFASAVIKPSLLKSKNP